MDVNLINVPINFHGFFRVFFKTEEVVQGIVFKEKKSFLNQDFNVLF